MSTERFFPVLSRGAFRDRFLSDLRYGFRQQIDPATGLPWTEEEIARATAVGSRWYIEADAFDLACLLVQKRAIFLVDQVDPRSASTEWLKGYHAKLWNLEYLPATSGSGPITGEALAGTVFAGSTTIGDPIAIQAQDENGLRYQVLLTTSADVNGVINATLIGIDTGEATNLRVGKELRWINPPLGAKPTLTVVDSFSGGTNIETDADFVRRFVSYLRERPAAGNRAQIRSWARESSNAVQDAFVYPCAHHTGSVHVAVLQKRGQTVGPLGRIPNLVTLTAVTARLVPPSSPLVPARAYVVVTGVNPVATNSILRLLLPKGTTSGWSDFKPWPTETCSVVSVVPGPSPVVTVATASAAPATTKPKLMAWNPAKTRWEKLNVNSVTTGAPGEYIISLSSAPSFTLVAGDLISPDIGRSADIGAAIERYFDSLGPGELVDLATDDRAHRAFRFPLPIDEYPSRAGRLILQFIEDALGPVLGDDDLESMSVTTPPLPNEVIDGPSLIVCGKVGAYPL